MNFLQNVTRSARRLMSLYVVAALAAGTAGTVVTPSTALAQNGLSDLTASPAFPGTFALGQRDFVGVVLQNSGNSTLSRIELKVMISKGFGDVMVRGAFGQQWDCGPLEVDAQTGTSTIICQTIGVEVESHKSLLVTATARDESDLWMVAIADPKNKIWEIDDENNVGNLNLGPSPEVRAPQFQNPGYNPNE